LENDMTQQIAVGDTVTWRSGKKALEMAGKKHEPLGIAGCTIIDLGKTATDEPAAMLKLPPVFDDAVRGQGLDPRYGVAVLCADLEKD
jgi:hypothetical protein